MNHLFNQPTSDLVQSGVHRTKSPFLLLLVAGLVLSGQVTAQTFTTLHSFDGDRDGGNPNAGLVLSGRTLYGSTSTGGNKGDGTVFGVNTDGTSFRVLHYFTNADSFGPNGGLVLSGNTLYGTTKAGGGVLNLGTVFAVNTDGTGFKVVYDLTNSTSQKAPISGLVLSNNILYGEQDYGELFSLNTDGTGFMLMPLLFPDLGELFGGLTLSTNTLYGTSYGGPSGSLSGAVYALNTDGTGFTALYAFTPLSNDYPATNSDGANPQAGLVLSGNTLYGTAVAGGIWGGGTVFKLNTDGTGFTILHSFLFTLPGGGMNNNYTNMGGASPGGLVLSGNTLYGTSGGGSLGQGTVFAMNTDGTGFTTLYNFSALTGPNYSGTSGTNSDGGLPTPSLILSGNTLYGTTYFGGNSGWGTVFSISFTPQLTITPSGPNVILSWPTNYAGFDYSGYTLQSSTNLPSGVWTTNLPAPVVVNGQYTVTNPISGTQQFFRLSQ
jgi:uncharacterized repeat protein (TIGR03803 family)